MSDRDRLAELIAVAMPASFDHITWPECLAVATALLAAGVTPPKPETEECRLAALFRLHRFIPGRQGVLAECGCGAIEDLAVTDWHENHCADALIAAGVTMPEPEPEERT